MNARSLDIVNAVAAALAVVLASVSLVWQAITWRRSGGMAKADLYVGAIDRTYSAYITLPAKYSLTELEVLEREGFIRKAVMVTVRNTGRLPITIQRWSFQFSRKYKSAQSAFAIGPRLPFRIDAGASETWAVEVDKIAPIIRTLQSEGRGSRNLRIRAEVELGDNRSVLTRQEVRI